MMALRMIGRSFIALGVLILLFLAYQLFGTNFVTGREQKALASDLASQWKVESPAHVKPDLGGGIALIKIPKIGVDKVVVEGVEVEHLKKGPGHYPETAMPGQLGNMVISGHRTTYGAPFYRLDEVKVGDEIVVVDAVGTYKYLVTESKVVRPTDLGVIAPSTDARLTLTTCHPRFSARERLIIVAALQGAAREAAA
jgi:sortase A